MKKKLIIKNHFSGLKIIGSGPPKVSYGWGLLGKLFPLIKLCKLYSEHIAIYTLVLLRGELEGVIFNPIL